MDTCPMVDVDEAVRAWQEMEKAPFQSLVVVEDSQGPGELFDDAEYFPNLPMQPSEPETFKKIQEAQLYRKHAHA